VFSRSESGPRASAATRPGGSQASLSPGLRWLVVLFAFVALAAPAGAAAHLGSGVVVVDYRASVVSPNPAVKARVYQSDRALSVTAEPGHIVVDSYGSGGKWVAAANELVFALVGIAFVVRGSRQVKAIAGGAFGFLGLGVGLSKTLSCSTASSCRFCPGRSRAWSSS
jgi:hypothetical protein